MKDTPGMNEKDEKEGKTAKLAPSNAKQANKKIEAGSKAAPPTKTIDMVTNARNKKKNK
ncbi:MAG: hypothetical protein H0W12_05730 [Chitinophagaceae bacterium]|nr:hypothetical protein [Chitinophagaceae bacterium]